MSTLADKLARLACLDPSDPVAPCLRAEIEAMQEQEAIAYARWLVAQGQAGAALARHHSEPAQKAFLESQRRMLGK